MKRNLFKTPCGLPIILTVILLYTSCKKESVAELKGLSGFIEHAKSWFNSTYVIDKKRQIIGSSAVRVSNLGKLLKWEKGISYEYEGLKYVIVPIDHSMKAIKNKKYVAGRAVVIYQDASNKMHLTIIEAISKAPGETARSFAEILQKAFLNKMFAATSDISQTNMNILFYNDKYGLEDTFRTTDGKWTRDRMQIITRKRTSGRKETVSAVSSSVNSESNCTTWYMVGIWYDVKTGEVVDYMILNEWTECDNNYDPEYGGTGSEPEDCQSYCSAAAKSLYEGAQVVSETVSINSIPIDPLTKHYNPRWVILKNVSWKIYSQEYGIVELVDPVTDKWQWKSLKHGKIEFSGTSYGGDVTPIEGIGTPSFVEGTPNVLVAGMSLNFSIKYSPICNCEGIDKILPPVTHNYTATAFWPAKPQSTI